MSYGWSFHRLMNAIAKGEKKAPAIDEWYKADRDSFKTGYHMHFITNHDENSWNGTEYERMGKAVDAMAVLAFTFDGMPLIYSGQEAAMDKRLQFFEKDSIIWGNFSKQDFYKTLLELKHQNQAIWNGAAGGNLKRFDAGSPDIYSFYREKNGDKVIVLLNLSDAPKTATFKDAVVLGSYSDIFGRNTTTVNKGMTLPMKPWGYLVLSNK
jgi:alpha-amylase